MNDQARRVIFDCNIFAQAIITPGGCAGQCVEKVLDGTISLFWSRYVLAELRRIPEKPTPKRMGVTAAIVEELIVSLGPLAHFSPEPRSIYVHPFDPKDSHYVDLALANNAQHIVSRDKHLLNLMDASKPGGSDFLQRFPQISISTPEQLLALLRKP